MRDKRLTISPTHWHDGCKEQASQPHANRAALAPRREIGLSTLSWLLRTSVRKIQAYLLALHTFS
jgi:hypothetical protein